jgi:hypothetical protein
MPELLLDQMTEAAIEHLLADGALPRALPAVLARRWPDVPPLEVVLVMVTAANGIERMLTAASTNCHMVEQTWRMSALVSVDYHVMQSLRLPHKTASDLLLYWKLHDSFFLTDADGVLTDSPDLGAGSQDDAPARNNQAPTI